MDIELPEYIIEKERENTKYSVSVTFSWIDPLELKMSPPTVYLKNQKQHLGHMLYL